ncbi:MAG: hypothetical protein KF681_12600 [Bdellovibrionaceae bacterium]|nr:hypothetical protein [Pseudobdellovibrionaceae bacterium]
MSVSCGPMLHLKAGEIIICAEASTITTILGSCVSICLYSPQTKMGGMIHYVHPRVASRHGQPADFRYGEIAIPALIEELMRVTGEPAHQFVAKIAGGASEAHRGFDIGSENIQVAREYLKRHQIPILAEDVSGHDGRKVVYHTGTNRLQIAAIASRVPPAKRISKPPLSCQNIDMRKILAIGSSTGGTEALRVVLQALPEKIPPTVVVQHIPPGFSKALAERLNDLCPFEVKEAEDGDDVRAGRVLIAPGGKQMKIHRAARGLVVRLTDDPPVNRHKPSVDYLFNSIADHIGKNSVGVILTGMGNDGSQGLLAMKKKGSKTIAQNEESCVVYGMPRVAADIGAVDKVVALEEIAREIVAALSQRAAA